MTYNGFENYETWNVNLWLNNDETMYRYCMYLVHRTRKEENQTYELSKLIQEYVENKSPAMTGMFADIITHALNAVDWYRIAEIFLE